MIDLAKPLGIHEGLVFYGDHELTDLIYYFPDEVGLAPLPNVSDGKFYELFFQIFNEGDIIEGGLDDLRKTAGSILSLGIQCNVSDERLQKALSAVKGVNRLPEKVTASIPLWRDGTVNLLVLDAVNDKELPTTEDAFVKSIVGSHKPSLMSSDLKSIFNVRLDRKGTALILSALNGDTGNVAGVMYDLKYNAIRPAVDLRIWADLGRCYESISHHIDVKAEFSYASLNFSFGAEFEWATRKLEEEGNLKIQVLSQVEDAEAKKAIDELVKEFKENILREMFRPYVNPQTLNSMIPGQKVPAIGVTYKFMKENIFHKKIIDVDYRERSTVTRTHNPQSHLWIMGKQIAENKDKYVQRVIFSDIWREQSLSINLVHDFNDASQDLLSAEVLVWRSEDGIVTDNRENRFAIPDIADPLKHITFFKGSNLKADLAWLYDVDEPVGYFHQIRFQFSGTVDNISSPAEIITEPVLSTNEKLIIFPNTYTFFKTIEVRAGNISFEEFKNVDISLALKNEAGDTLGVEIITLTGENKNEVWKVRGKDKKNLFIEITKEYHYNDERPSLKTEPVFLQDDEVIINKPFQKSVLKLIPVIAGKNDAVKEVLLEIKIASPALEEPVTQLNRITGPAFNAPEIEIKLHSDNDSISYEATAITTDGKILKINNGLITSNALILDLSRTLINEVLFVWQGKSPLELGLKSLKVELRKVSIPAQDLEPIEFKGGLVPTTVTKLFPVDDIIEWRILKRFENNFKERTDFKPVVNNKVLVVAE
ncbi:MAG: hypothetical protein QM762_18210 [Chryseolinea sp.]